MEVQLCDSVSHQNKLCLLWLHKPSNPGAHHCCASGFSLLHPLPEKPVWDLMAWITASPSATPSSTETRPLSTEDAPCSDPESWAMQGTEWGQPAWTLQGREAAGFPDLSPVHALLSTGS